MVSPIDIGGKIFDIFSGLDSKQKCLIEVTNSTGHTLKRLSDEHSSGGFATLPEDEIAPDGKDVFISHDTGILRGADGKVTYGVFPEGADAAIGKWTIHWDIPQVGTPSSEAPLDGLDAGKFQSLHRIGDGNETEAKFELKAAHDKKDPEKKDDKKTPATGELKSTVLITVKNETDETLTLIHQEHDHGGFVNLPEVQIPPHESNSFASYETDRGKPGTAGFLKYQVTQDCEWKISWDNPENADNTSNSELTGSEAGQFTGLDQIGAGEENVPATFTITSRRGGRHVPPPPHPTDTENVVEIGIFNKTQQTLHLLDSGSYTGRLRTQPPQQIAADGSALVVSAETEDDQKTGASGFVRYYVGDPGGTLWTVFWDNPESGENTVDDGVEGPGSSSFLTDRTISQEKQLALASFSIAGDPAPIPEPEPEWAPPPEADEPTLRIGDHSVDGWVEYLQGLLNTKGFGPLPVDGNFDGTVQGKVREFQSTARDQAGGKLMVDGVVGNQTWAALREEDPRDPSTDGRQPHTYVEHGFEARFQTEDHAIDYFPDEDSLSLTAVNVGDQIMAPAQFDATVRITFPDGDQHTFTVPLVDFPGTLQPGDLLFFQGPLRAAVHVEIPPGTHLIEAYLPAELGGDEAAQQIEIP